MPQQLVVTAIGADRTGIVSKLARLVSDCNCNIVDSRMAIFGHEFTFIMLISGDGAAISRIEFMLPSLGLELDLATMSKRTSGASLPQLSIPYVLQYTGEDKVGTLGTMSSLLAEHHVYIGALSSETIHPEPGGPAHTHTVMTVQLPAELAFEQLYPVVMDKLAALKLTGKFAPQADPL